MPAAGGATLSALSWLLQSRLTRYEQLRHLKVLEHSALVCLGGLVALLIGSNLGKQYRKMLLIMGAVALGLAAQENPEIRAALYLVAEGTMVVMVEMAENGVDGAAWRLWIQRNKQGIYRVAEAGAIICLLSSLRILFSRMSQPSRGLAAAGDCLEVTLRQRSNGQSSPQTEARRGHLRDRGKVLTKASMAW